MSKNIVGIDISDFSIEAVVLEKKKGHFVVETYSRFRLSPDIVEDGKIINRDKLKDALQRLFRNALPKPIGDEQKIFLSIPESKVFTRILNLPKNLKEKEIHEAAAHRAEEVIPESPDNLVSAMKLLPVNGDNREVFYTEAEIDIVNDFISIFKSLDMDIEGITTEAVSSFAGLHNDFKKDITLMLDIGARTTIASIFDANGIRASVNINIAGNNITSALVKKMGINHQAAEEVKHKYGMTSAEDGGAMMIIQGQLQPLVDELKKFVNYYQEESGQKIEHLVLIGGLAQMKGIDKYFGDNLSMTAAIGRPFIDRLPDSMGSTKYINALGLAKLGHEKPDIDFYDSIIRHTKREKEQEEHKKSKQKSKSDKDNNGTEPPFYKNKLFMIFLLVLMAVGGYFIYKFVLQKDNSADTQTPLVVEQSVDNFSDIEIKPGLEFSGQIIASNVAKPGTVGLVAAEPFEVKTEMTFQSSEDMDYFTAFDAMLAQIADEEAAKLNTEYIKNGYYIVPVVIRQTEEKSLPGEDEYVPGVALSAIINSEFLAIPELSVRAMLTKKLSSEQITDINENYNLRFDYQVISKAIGSDDASINMSVIMTLESK